MEVARYWTAGTIDEWKMRYLQQERFQNHRRELIDPRLCPSLMALPPGLGLESLRTDAYQFLQTERLQLCSLEPSC